MESIDRLVAENEIRRVLTLYARGVDRHNWELVRSCFHSDATDHHLDYSGGIDGLIDWQRARHSQVDHSVHHLGNILVDLVDEEHASCETYCLVFLRRTEGEESRELVLHSRYIDVFEKRLGSWRIASRVVVYGVSRDDSIVGGFEQHDALAISSWAHAAFGNSDPLYESGHARWSE